MTREEEHVCALEYARTRSPVLAARLVAANMRLVVKLAYGYLRPQYDIGDLVQEGNLGLVHAVGRYDANRGVRLCSYAAWWIRAYISKYTLHNWRLVKAGTTEVQRKLFFKMGKHRRLLESQGIEADSHRLSVAMNLKEKDVALMMERATGSEISWDGLAVPADGERRSLADTLGAAPALQPDWQLETADFASHLRQQLETFAETLVGRELTIFRRRLLCDAPQKLAALALEFGVSRERVRQLEARLKARLRDDLTRTLGDALEVGREVPRASTIATPARDAAPGARTSRPGFAAACPYMTAPPGLPSTREALEPDVFAA